MRHFVIVGVLVLLIATLTYVGINHAGLMPVEASAQSIPVDWMWNLEMIAISFLFALIVVPMVYSLIVFRRKKGDTTDAKHVEGNTPLEITWTIIPLFTVLVFAYLGAYTLGQTRAVDPGAMVIKVKAIQWAWSFEYPDGLFQKNFICRSISRCFFRWNLRMSSIHFGFRNSALNRTLFRAALPNTVSRRF